jgi:hypothetical protein
VVAVGGSTPARPAGRIASMLVGTALGTLILALTLTLTACPTVFPSEADDSRLVRFAVKVPYRGTYPRDPDPQRLTVGAADTGALRVISPVSTSDFGTFVIDTEIEIDGDARYEHCLLEPLVVTDVGSGEAVAELPAGTCLREGTTSEAPLIGQGDKPSG